ncbi:MAG: UDP-glucose/GDP-mannose dehydrogenase family protein [Armatimonadetes bacterium]|nr:UDP-glucose/GDP-mannose dehydrogenase family protein [Armatimonadota bacterium]
MKVCIVGTGYVGLVTGTVLSHIGHEVVCVDQNAEKVRALQGGNPCIYEPSLEKMLVKSLKSKTIRFTTDIPKTVRQCDVVFICVGTPSLENGEVDMTQYQQVLYEIALSLNGSKLVVNKSTVPVGTARWAQKYIKKMNPDLNCEVASNPEFLREGQAIHDMFHPERIVIGARSLNATLLLTQLYEPLEAPMEVCEPESAELIKYANNAFLAMKVSFANWLAIMADHFEANIDEVTRGLGADSRIGADFLRSGLGFGGSCFPKDVHALIAMAGDAGLPKGLLEATLAINEEMPHIYCRMLEHALGGLQDRRIGVLGLSFKPGTDDVRASQAMVFINLLLERDATVTVHDPAAADESLKTACTRVTNMYDVAHEADALCLLTEWEDYVAADTSIWLRKMRQPYFLDTRNAMKPETMKMQGWEYLSLGRNNLEGKESV